MRFRNALVHVCESIGDGGRQATELIALVYPSRLSQSPTSAPSNTVAVTSARRSRALIASASWISSFPSGAISFSTELARSARIPSLDCHAGWSHFRLGLFHQVGESLPILVEFGDSVLRASLGATSVSNTIFSPSGDVRSSIRGNSCTVGWMSVFGSMIATSARQPGRVPATPHRPSP